MSASRPSLWVLTVLVLCFLVAPSLIIVPMSFSAGDYLQFPPQGLSLRWHAEVAQSPAWRDALWVSVRVAVANTAVSLALGIAAAYGLIHWRSRWRELVFGLLLTPMIFPVILLAIGSFYIYAKLGLLDSITGLVLAHSALALPVVLVMLTAALSNVDFNQEKAARVLGASRLQAFMHITLPQIRFALASAGLFAFLTSFDEVVVTLFISGGDATTLTKKMFTALRDVIDPTVAAISTWVLLFTCIALVAAQLLPQRGSRAGAPKAAQPETE
ncbi:ABC transporter permease [Variovorax sp. PBL-E5]|uniref:ABC transporter permease n=1 Tax=Variovorax sp. PBL-E5 TaxID=434014 RepID=UPI0013178F9A|nr:ABC transporter permease [Variovorax sp. PBL-E5]VTU37802.1 Inner membrane ABC transporter permease protein YdcV [Variovorax sp. PBL-E5]